MMIKMIADAINTINDDENVEMKHEDFVSAYVFLVRNNVLRISDSKKSFLYVDKTRLSSFAALMFKTAQEALQKEGLM